jgi:GTP-binding protein HflX
VVHEGVPFLLTDTVGFIRKLPATLIESFKSTLDEVREADILLHVVDIAHPSFEEQIEVVNTTLAEIGAADKPMILVFNKLDLYQPESESALDPQPDEDEKTRLQNSIRKLKQTYLTNNTEHVVFISAEQKENLDELRTILLNKVKNRHFQIYPNWLPEHAAMWTNWETLAEEE